jgi:hypothetical protein
MSAADDYDYERIKELGQEMKRSVETLVVLSTVNDPFYIQPGRQASAEWFAKLWEELKCGPGTHIRAVHYRLLSHAGGHFIGDDGRPYLNTDRCYKRLNNASQDARYLGLVPEDHFDDRRNDEPVEYLPDRESGSSTFYVGGAYDGIALDLRLESSLPALPRFLFNPPAINNQRYHVELWCEKTTMNDVLLNLAQQYGLNVITASGEMSITHCWKLIQRALASQRPVRILYISDFDPAGRGMPVACARKIEFFIRRDKLALDVRLRPVALTPEQCEQYRLPRMPIKDEARAERFETQYGEGATELDALEALHPGELRRILQREIRRYYDTQLSSRIREAEAEFREQLDDVREEVIGRHSDERDAIEMEHDDLIEQCNDALAQFRELLDQIDDRFQQLQRTIARELREEAPDPDSIEWPEPKEGDEDDDPLFDSMRDYLDQIARYKAHQGKSITERRPRYVQERLNARVRRLRAAARVVRP